MKKSVEGKPCINRESKSLELTFSYTDVMMNMNILAVVTPPSIYHNGNEDVLLKDNEREYL